MSKTYTFGGTTFTTEKNVFKIERAWNPLQMYFESLVKMFTAELDMSLVNAYQARIGDVNFLKDKVTRDLIGNQDAKPPNEALIKQCETVIEKHNKELEKIDEEFKNDEKAIIQQTEWLKAVNNASRQLICSELTPDFLNVYLIGDKSKFDYENWEMLDFAGEVIGDFMQLRAEVKKK